MRKNFSVNMVNTISAKEHKMKESAVEGPTVPAIEIDLETPDQSVDEVERKATESTPMPNAEEQEKKTIEFSPIDTVEDTTSITPEKIKDYSQTKRTSFTERIAAMVGLKTRYEEVVPTTETSKTFGTVSAITTEAKQDDEQIKRGATANHKKTTSLELGDLMAKFEQIDKKLKCSEEDRQMLKKEIRYNKNENLDNCFNLARATEEKLQQMSDKVEATDKEREKHIKTDMQEMKQRYDTVNEKLWNLESRMDTMSKYQAESSCAIQSKLEALLRNFTAQDKLVADRPQGATS
ncbi:caldesmon-like [Symsagittifera roscoffensis]|uniref:caldesmon-like n=1 Tax=Symsagittifera roscoffensis TaxID=84072 RepID=UPI00307B6E3D